VIAEPIRDVTPVFSYNLHLTAVDIETVNVKELWIALVHAEEDVFVIVDQFIQQHTFDVVQRGEIDVIAAIPIDRDQPHVFVTVFIHSVDDPLVVGPEIALDVPFRDAGDSDYLTALQVLDVDV